MVGVSRFCVRFREVVVAAVVYGEDDDVWRDLKKDGSFLETLFAITEQSAFFFPFLKSSCDKRQVVVVL